MQIIVRVGTQGSLRGPVAETLTGNDGPCALLLPYRPFLKFRADAERKKEKEQQLEEWAAGWFLLCSCPF